MTRWVVSAATAGVALAVSLTLAQQPPAPYDWQLPPALCFGHLNALFDATHRLEVFVEFRLILWTNSAVQPRRRLTD